MSMIITIAIEHVTLKIMAISICLIIINTIELSVHEETYIIIYICIACVITITYIHHQQQIANPPMSSTAQTYVDATSIRIGTTGFGGINPLTCHVLDLLPSSSGTFCWTTEEIIANLRYPRYFIWIGLVIISRLKKAHHCHAKVSPESG